MLKYLRCCAALPDAKFCVSLGNIKTHLAGREGGKAQGKGSERARTFILGHINTYYRLFELVNEAASAACDLLLFGQAFPWRFLFLSLRVCVCVKIDFLLSKKAKKVKNNKSLNTHTRLWTGFDKRRAQKENSVAWVVGIRNIRIVDEERQGRGNTKEDSKPPINGYTSLLVRVNLSWLKHLHSGNEKKTAATATAVAAEHEAIAEIDVCF